jgi:hypothetical protein
VRKRTPPIDRVLRRVVMGPDGCWVFTGATTLGYGRISRPQGATHSALAHRITYEYFVGPIPDGLELDHLCRVPLCCNPAHLQAVTSRENLLRGIHPNMVAARTGVCRNGHSDWHVRADGRRECRECRRLKRSASPRAAGDS